MTRSTLERSLILFFRITMGWTFLHAGLSQLLDPHWTAAGFLAHTKTFHDIFAPFASPGILPVTDFAVSWGHTLIGLSLIVGLLVRISGVFGALLMIVYYFAHMDFPYIESHFNFLVDYHLVDAGLVIYLIVARAGHVFGLDGVIEKLAVVQEHSALRPLFR